MLVIQAGRQTDNAHGNCGAGDRQDGRRQTDRRRGAGEYRYGKMPRNENTRVPGAEQRSAQVRTGCVPGVWISRTDRTLQDGAARCCDRSGKDEAGLGLEEVRQIT